MCKSWLGMFAQAQPLEAYADVVVGNARSRKVSVEVAQAYVHRVELAFGLCLGRNDVIGSPSASNHYGVDCQREFRRLL